ncbi:MAG: hypothetical protein Q8R17_02255, partial [bacterium]|nr:hypothetical protein [bacterium]
MPMRVELQGLRRKRSPNKARQFAWRAFFALSTLVAIFFGLSLFSFYTPFQIEKVMIIGINPSERAAERRAEASVARAFADAGVSLFSFTSKLFYPRKEIIDGIASTSPRIASVGAMRGGALVIIAVSEREPFAEWCSSTGECVFIDESGFGFAKAKGDASPRSNIVFEGVDTASGARYLPPEKFALLRNIVASAERVGLSIKKVARAEGNDFAFVLSDNAEARFV